MVPPRKWVRLRGLSHPWDYTNVRERRLQTALRPVHTAPHAARHEEDGSVECSAECPHRLSPRGAAARHGAGSVTSEHSREEDVCRCVLSTIHSSVECCSSLSCQKETIKKAT